MENLHTYCTVHPTDVYEVEVLLDRASLDKVLIMKSKDIKLQHGIHLQGWAKE